MADFFISEISGGQVPYNSELFRELRGVRAGELERATLEGTAAALELEALQNEATTRSSDAVVIDRLSSSDASEIVSDPGPGAIGLAGAQHARTEGTSSESRSSKVESTPPTAVREVQEVQPPPRLDVRPDNEQETIKPGKSAAAMYADESQSERRPVALAEDIMSTPVRTLQSSESLEQAWEMLSKYRYRHVPVVSEDGKLVGMLSDRNLLRRVREEYVKGSALESTRALLVGDIMVSNILTARPKTSIRQVSQVLFKERIGAMPIVDENEQMVGFLTRSDVLRSVVNRAPLELWS